MATRRRPKKALVQFLIAGVIALVLGGGAAVVGVAVIQGIQQHTVEDNKKAQDEAKKAQEEAAKAQADLQKVLEERNKSKVVQAAIDIAPGQLISKGMLNLVDEEGKAEPGTFDNTSKVVGQVAIAPIKAGEDIDRKKIKSSDGQIFVEDGKRAITIAVDDIGGLGGALSPGMSVDVLVTLPTNNDKAGGGGSSGGSGGKDSTNQLTRVLLQNIKVIAAGGNSGGSSSYGTHHSGDVTLSVSPDQAEKLVLANEIGKFHLVLRSYTDTKSAKMSPVDYDELVTGITPGDLAKQLPAAPKGPNINPVAASQNLPEPSGPEAKGGGERKMEIYTGSGMKTVTFQN